MDREAKILEFLRCKIKIVTFYLLHRITVRIKLDDECTCFGNWPDLYKVFL